MASHCSLTSAARLTPADNSSNATDTPTSGTYTPRISLLNIYAPPCAGSGWPAGNGISIKCQRNMQVPCHHPGTQRIQGRSRPGRPERQPTYLQNRKAPSSHLSGFKTKKGISPERDRPHKKSAPPAKQGHPPAPAGTRAPAGHHITRTVLHVRLRNLPVYRRTTNQGFRRFSLLYTRGSRVPY